MLLMLVFSMANKICGFGAVGNDQAAFDNLIQRTEESYQHDRGRSLLRAAFPDWTD